MSNKTENYLLYSGAILLFFILYKTFKSKKGYTYDLPSSAVMEVRA